MNIRFDKGDRDTNKRAQHETDQNNHGFGNKDELLLQQSG